MVRRLAPILLALALAPGCSVDDGSTSNTAVNLSDGRYGHTSTVLPDGRVVVIGGVERNQEGSSDHLIEEVEVYIPAENRFRTPEKEGIFERAFHAAAFSNGGTPADPADDYILVGGGLDVDAERPDLLSRTVIRVSADLTFDRVQDLPTPVMDHQAVTLGDGRVAFICGRDESGEPVDDVVFYDPTGRTIDESFNLSGQERWNHRAIFVPDGGAGAILVTGGRDEDNVQDDGVLIDVATLARTVFPLSGGQERQYHTLTLLDAGTPDDFSDDVIIETGGLEDVEEDILCCGNGDEDTRSIALYQVQSGSVTTIATGARLPEGVFFHAAAANVSGTALVVSGGFTTIFFDDDDDFTGDFIDSHPVDDAAVIEWFPGATAGTGTVAVTNRHLDHARAMHAAAPLADGRVLVTGGINSALNSVRGAEFITP